MILYKTSYTSTIEEILNDNEKCSNLDIVVVKEINYISNLQKRITSDLKLLKMKKLLISLFARILNQSSLDQITYVG